MRIEGAYADQGYACIRELIPVEVADAFLRQIAADLPELTKRFVVHAPIIRRTSIDVYARSYLRLSRSDCAGPMGAPAPGGASAA